METKKIPLEIFEGEKSKLPYNFGMKYKEGEILFQTKEHRDYIFNLSTERCGNGSISWIKFQR